MRSAAVIFAILAVTQLSSAICVVQPVISIPQTDPAGGATNVHITPLNQPPDGPTLNNEGLAERLADVLIFDSGVPPNCLSAGNVITLTYGAPITVPASIAAGTLARTAANFDAYDTGLALNFTAAALSSTTIQLTITSSGASGDLTTGAAGSAVRIKNLRADVTAISGGLNVTVAVSTTATGTAPAAPTKNVGIIAATIQAVPGPFISSGSGTQNSNTTLANDALFRFTEGFTGAFRAAGTSRVLNDAPTTSTSLILDAGSSVPAGVTVTFPNSIIGSTSGGAGVVFTLRSGGTCPGITPCAAIYDATTASAARSTITVVTAASPRTGANGSSPAIGVHVASPSGAGTVSLRAFFGPGAAAGAGNDDVNASAVPRYVASNIAPAPTRLIFAASNWFTITPSSPVAVLSTSQLSFSEQFVGTTSIAQPVILTNTSTLPLGIASISISSGAGDFAISGNNCGASLAGSSSCQISVVFTPLQAGSRSGTLTLVDNAPGSPHTVSLIGLGATISPAPTATSLTPATAPAGTAAVSVVVTGANFQPTSEVQFNGLGRGTTRIDSNQLRASLTAQDLAVAGVAQITVSTPAPGGGTSNPLPFTVGAAPLPNTPHLYFLPHVPSGAGFVTKITVVNITGASNNVTVNFITQSGVRASSNTYPLARGATLRVSTDEAARFSPLRIQWAVVGSEQPVAVNLFFEFVAAPGQPVANSVGFNDAPPMTEFSLPAEFEPVPQHAPTGRTIGLALANTSGAVNLVTLRLVDSSGALAATYSFNLAPFAQAALDLSQVPEIRSALPAANWVGSITVAASSPVASIALFDDYGPFSATPAVRGKAE